MKKQKTWHNRDHHNGPVRMSLSKYGLKDLAVCFHPRTISCGSALWTRLPQNTIWSILCLQGPTIMDSAKQINFLPIFKVFQNWRIYLFGWHSIPWTLTAKEAKKFFVVFKRWRRPDTVEQPLPFREGEFEAECNLGQGHRGCWWQRPVDSLCPIFPVIWSTLLVPDKTFRSCSVLLNQGLCLMHAECDKTTEDSKYHSEYQVTQRPVD